MANKIFGTLAEFDSAKSLLHAAQEVRDAGYTNFDVYSPFPIHGMDDAMGLRPTIMGWLVLGGGITGLTVGFGIQTWVSIFGYKLVISGKPFFSYQAFIPVTFELMVLLASFGAVFGMFALNKLPEWYHSLLKDDEFKKVTSHGFFLAIETKDPNYNTKSVESILSKAGSKNIREIES